MTGYAGAIQMINGNSFANRDGLKPRYVILHGTAGGSSAQNIASYFAQTQGTANEVSSTYIDGQDGAIVQCIDENNGAYGNGILTAGHEAFWDNYKDSNGQTINPNLITISIEHVKSATDNSNALTPAQQASSFKLINDICDRWNIPKHAADGSGGITGHYSIDPVSRANCPGPYPWDQLWTYLQGGQSTDVAIELNTPGVSDFFGPANNGQWRTKTGLHVGGAILSWYKRFGAGLAGLTNLGLPVTEEINPGISGHAEVRVQGFERGVVAYDPHHVVDGPPQAGDVYVLHIERSPQFASLSHNLDTLKTAYADLTKEKNGLVTTNGQLSKQIIGLQQQLASGTNSVLLQQQINTLTAQRDALNVKIQQAVKDLAS